MDGGVFVVGSVMGGGEEGVVFSDGSKAKGIVVSYLF